MKEFNRLDNLNDHVRRQHPLRRSAATLATRGNRDQHDEPSRRDIESEDDSSLHSLPSLGPRPTKRRRYNNAADEDREDEERLGPALLRHELTLKKARIAELTARLHESETKREELQRKYDAEQKQHREELMGIIGQLTLTQTQTQQGK